jgi:tRNA-dihydrouridine synthase
VLVPNLPEKLKKETRLENNFMNFLNKKNLIALAPMDGITDEVFRLLQSQIAKPDLIFTEFVSAEGISHGGVKLFDTLLFSHQERPIIGQLFGKDPDSFYKSAVILFHLGFDGIDINMGCPAKTVIRHGSGAALIENQDLAIKIINSTRQGIDDYFNKKITIKDLGLKKKTLDVIKRNQKYSQLDLKEKRLRLTLSVKTRLGVNKSIVKDWVKVLLAQNLDFITIHGRTLKQGYSGQADWSAIDQIVKIAEKNKSKTKIFGNGDIQSRKQALEYLKKYNLDGILIGRAASGNPWLFNDHLATNQERFSAMANHAHLFEKIFPHRRFDSLRKHFLFYTSNFPQAKSIRKKIVRLNSVKELLKLEDDFLNC